MEAASAAHPDQSCLGTGLDGKRMAKNARRLTRAHRLSDVLDAVSPRVRIL